MNGHYPQEQVDRWSAYHDYKGADNMEAKKQEMTQAIQDGKLQQWVDQSMQNYNVWTYYYFSGEAPSMPNYHDAGFELITRDKMHIQDIISIHNPFWYDPQNWIITAIMASAVITPIIIIWRKRR